LQKIPALLPELRANVVILAFQAVGYEVVNKLNFIFPVHEIAPPLLGGGKFPQIIMIRKIGEAVFYQFAHFACPPGNKPVKGQSGGSQERPLKLARDNTSETQTYDRVKDFFLWRLWA
jgi:hypothetical protein